MFYKPVLQQVADSLCRQKQTLAVAESVTAGMLQTAFAAADNATAFFQGGITAYNARQKYTHLSVDLQHAISCNCVSAVIASEMALGVSRSFLSDWGIGITGYASPLPGHDMDPLYAFFAISFRHKIVGSGEITSAKKEALQVQQQYVEAVLQRFLQLLYTTA